MSRYNESESRGRGGRGDDRPAASRSRDRDDPPSRRARDDDDRPARDGSSRRGSRFEYQARSEDQARKRSEASGGDFDKYLVDGIKMFKVNDGPNTIRILPPTWPKPEHFGHDIWVHYGVGPDRQTYLCLHKMKGEKCPICEERIEAERAGDEKYAKELKPRQRVLMFIVDRDHEKEGVQAWAAPWTVDRDLAKVSRDRQSGQTLFVDHPEEGYDIEFEKKGAKDRTEYLGIAVARRESSLGSDLWLEFAVEHPLPDQLQYFDYDHIAQAFGGATKKSDRDDPPARGGRDHDETADRRSHGADEDRGRGRDRDEPPARRGREEANEDVLTWDQIHGMKSSELDDLVEVKSLSLSPAKFSSDVDLADAICEELGVEKARTHGRRSTGDDPPPRRGREEAEEPAPRRRSSGDDEPPSRRGRGDDDDAERLARMRRDRDEPAPRRSRGD